VTFPVGISYSRCAWDNLGRVSRDPKEKVRYLLAGIKFLDEEKEVPAGKVTVRRLDERELILHAKSYDARLVISLGDLDSKEKIDENRFFDYSNIEFRLLKESLVANGIIREGSDNIKEDILRFTNGGGLEVTVDTIVPGGTGLGTSGAVSTALCAALDWFTNHKGSVDDDILSRSIYLEHRLGLGSGTQDCRRPVKGSSPFKICYQESGKPFPSVSFEFLDSVDSEKAARHLVLFFPGFKRQATGRLNTVLSGYLARDEKGYQAMRDVIELQDIIEEDGFKKNDYQLVGRFSTEYQNYRDIMDPTEDEHVLKAIDAIKKAPGIWGANFTGSPGGVMMIWCPEEKRDEIVDYMEGLKDNPALTHENEPIFKNAQVLNPVFSNEGYKINIKEPDIDIIESLDGIKKSVKEQKKGM
jgi:galactokinase/mevalonate kinase-like predicted kinase